MEKYEKLPDPPEEASASNVVARIMDGLGFRYNCATEGLNDKDICFKVSRDFRNIGEIANHIHDLIMLIAKAIGLDTTGYESSNTFEQVRKATLSLINEISNTLKTFNTSDLLEFKMQPYHNNKDYSFWFLLNGQIADALTHVGQINALRRMSGNPVKKHSPLRGIKL